MKNSKRMFTLIELLIVIAIIGVLASMLLPALKKARNKAKTIACVANMKQVGQGFHMYAGDFGGTLPAQGTPFPSHDSIIWSTNIWPYIYNEKDSKYDIPGYKDQYAVGMKKETVFFCPARDDESMEGKPAWFFSYGLNYRFADRLDASLGTSSPLKWNSVRKPSATSMVIDSYNCAASYGELSQIMAASKRHSSGNNVLYSDTHIDWKKYVDFPAHDMNIFWRWNGVN